MNIRYTPRAVADLVDIADYIRERHSAGSDRVATAIETIIGRLAQNPRLGIDRPDLDSRWLGVPRHPYSIYYRIHGDVVEIVHIRDDRRRPLKSGEL